MMWRMFGFKYYHNCVFVQSYTTLYIVSACLGPTSRLNGHMLGFNEVV